MMDNISMWALYIVGIFFVWATFVRPIMESLKWIKGKNQGEINKMRKLDVRLEKVQGDIIKSNSAMSEVAINKELNGIVDELEKILGKGVIREKLGEDAGIVGPKRKIGAEIVGRVDGTIGNNLPNLTRHFASMPTTFDEWIISNIKNIQKQEPDMSEKEVLSMLFHNMTQVFNDQNVLSN